MTGGAGCWSLPTKALRLFDKARTFALDKKRALNRPRFPVLEGRPCWPSNRLCPQCKKRKVMGHHPTVIFAGGAMKVTDAKKKSAGMADDCVGFLYLGSHGGTDVDSQASAHVELVEWTPNGQFEFYFCSAACLRAFLNACVDEVEVQLGVSSRARKKR